MRVPLGLRVRSFAKTTIGGTNRPESRRGIATRLRRRSSSGGVRAAPFAENADALHQLLVLRQPFRRESDATVPMYLLEKHHETEPSTSVVTAMLLLTDRRWRHGRGRLVRR